MMYPNGWLEFGANDDSIVFQHDLCSDPTDYITALGATYIVQGSGLQTFDSVRGMNPNGSGGYRIQNLPNRAALDFAGQVTFEVEREWLCKQAPGYYSFGLVPASNQTALSALATAGGVGSMCSKAVVGNAYTSGPFGSQSVGCSSAGKGDYVRVNLGWSGGRVGGKSYLSFDGDEPREVTRNTATLSDLFASWWIGSDRGVAGTFPSYYMRKLQLSTRPPMFAVHPLLRRVAILSDSIMNSDNVTAGNYLDAVSSREMRRVLAQRGIHVGAVDISINGGYRLDNSIPAQYLHDQLAALLANNPTLLIIRGGTNDAAGSRCTVAGWQAQVEQYLTTAFATPSVRGVILPNIPPLWEGATAYDTAAFREQVATGNQIMAQIATDWRASNPTDPRSVIVPDAYAALGGDNPAAGTYIGQVSGAYNDLHLSGYGHVLHGRSIAAAIVRLLGGQAV